MIYVLFVASDNLCCKYFLLCLKIGLIRARSDSDKDGRQKFVLFWTPLLTTVEFSLPKSVISFKKISRVSIFQLEKKKSKSERFKKYTFNYNFVNVVVLCAKTDGKMHCEMTVKRIVCSTR